MQGCVLRAARAAVPSRRATPARALLNNARRATHAHSTNPAPRPGSFRGRTADFLWMLLFGGALLTALAPFADIEFLGSSLTFMMVRGAAACVPWGAVVVIDW